MLKFQNIRGNQISVGARLESRYTVVCNKLGSYCVILKLICLFVLLFCLQNARMVTIYWFYMKLKSYERHAGCGLIR